MSELSFPLSSSPLPQVHWIEEILKDLNSVEPVNQIELSSSKVQIAAQKSFPSLPSKKVAFPRIAMRPKKPYAAKQYLKAPKTFVSFFGGSDYFRGHLTESTRLGSFLKNRACKNDYDIYVHGKIAEQAKVGFIYYLDKTDEHLRHLSCFKFFLLEKGRCRVTSCIKRTRRYMIVSSFEELKKNFGLRNRLPPDPKIKVNGEPYLLPSDD